MFGRAGVLNAYRRARYDEGTYLQYVLVRNLGVAYAVPVIIRSRGKLYLFFVDPFRRVVLLKLEGARRVFFRAFRPPCDFWIACGRSVAIVVAIADAKRYRCFVGYAY